MYKSYRPLYNIKSSFNFINYAYYKKQSIFFSFKLHFLKWHGYTIPNTIIITNKV